MECQANVWTDLDEVEAMYALGFRPPSSDQWEYACAAGSRTLFRWGNECRTDFSPERFVSPRAEHRRPNAFGLTIASNPQHCEACLESHILRGGDGGVASTSGKGEFYEWLSLATPFVCVNSHELWQGEARFRRTYPLT
jgi:hypothetical protein